MVGFSDVNAGPILDLKITKNRSPGTRLGSQNGPELTSEKPKIPKMAPKGKVIVSMDLGLCPDGSKDRFGGPPSDPGPAEDPQSLKTDSGDLVGSGGLWRALAVILGIMRSRQLPLALRLPNPLITRNLVDI